MLTDTHCHIHEPGDLAIDDILAHAAEQQVSTLVCVGTSQESSRQAVAFAQAHPGRAYAIIGVHPHETKDGWQDIARLAADPAARPFIVGIGEIGLDYFYSHSPRDVQLQGLREQLQIATQHQLPVSFHVREAFDDFWPLFDEFPGLRGVLHSFTDSPQNLQRALQQGLYIGINGISTFTKQEAQKQLFDSVPLERVLFETDAPFLTPVPFRGKINEPAYIRVIAQYHAKRRGLSLTDIAAATTHNARTLFTLS